MLHVGLDLSSKRLDVHVLDDAERERARWRLHLVRHRTALKNRIHATLVSFSHPCPVSDLFGPSGHELLKRLQLPEPWRLRCASDLIIA